MNFLLFLTILAAFSLADFKKILFLAFVFGLINDLVFGNWFGFSSLIFLSFCFLIFLYQKKFTLSHLLFQLVFILGSDFIFTWIKGEIYSFKQTLVLAGLSLIIFPLINRIKRKELIAI